MSDPEISVVEVVKGRDYNVGLGKYKGQSGNSATHLVPMLRASRSHALRGNGADLAVEPLVSRLAGIV